MIGKLVIAGSLAATLSLTGCGGSSKSSGAASGAGSKASASASASANSNPSSKPIGADKPLRLDGQYKIISARTTIGLPVNFRPTCPSGPCTAKIDYDVTAGAKGSGQATWDGKQYTATIQESYGCKINGVVVTPAAEGTVTMTIQVSPTAPSPTVGVAYRAIGTWSGSYHLVGQAVGHPGCDGSYPSAPFIATFTGPAA